MDDIDSWIKFNIGELRRPIVYSNKYVFMRSEKWMKCEKEEKNEWKIMK